MKTLEVFLIVSCTGLILHTSAKFYIEFRSNLLFECTNTPGREAGRNAQYVVVCNPITDVHKKEDIYGSYNFFIVWKPSLPRTTLRLRGQKPEGQLNYWNLGFSTNTKDLPYFGEVSQDARQYYKNRVAAMGPCVTDSQRASVEEFFALQDVNEMRSNHQNTQALFETFRDVLERMINIHAANRQGQRNNELRNAVNVALYKMIDPCAVIADNPRRPEIKNQFCAVYCSFFKLAVQLFGSATQVCTGLTTGYCESSHCMCFRTLNLIATHTKCSVAMRYCSNSLRAALPLLKQNI